MQMSSFCYISYERRLEFCHGNIKPALSFKGELLKRPACIQNWSVRQKLSLPILLDSYNEATQRNIIKLNKKLHIRPR